MSAPIFKGTNTTDSALSGYAGEYVESVVDSGSRITLVSNTATNITSISLTAGDWDVEGNSCYNSDATTLTTSSVAEITTTSATITTVSGRNSFFSVAGGTPIPSLAIAAPVLRKRISISSTTTVYLVTRAVFSTGDGYAYGAINARRVR